VAVFTDVTIKKRIKSGDLIISPLIEENITGVGYDVTASDIVMLRQNGRTTIVKPTDIGIEVPSGAMILVLTKEQVGLSKRVAATIHSAVSLVSRGMSHISTTIDPRWYGRLLLAMTNVSSSPIVVSLKEPIATIVFHTVVHPTSRNPRRIPGRPDVIMAHMLERELGKIDIQDPLVLASVRRDLDDDEDRRARKAVAEFAYSQPLKEAWATALSYVIAPALICGGGLVLLRGQSLLGYIWDNFSELSPYEALGIQLTIGLAIVASGWAIATRR
jgi:deoxycytidine triphosphate deaminase